MLFGVVFIEKNAKKKKKQDPFENPYLHNGSTLEQNSN
jgi:hypothetical protein